MFEAHSQIICKIFGVHIYFYGVILALAITAGIFVSNYFAERKFGFPKDIVIDMAPYLVFFGIIGARLYYCILNHDFYLRFPTEILAIRHGGISIHGAILGGFLGLVLFAKRKKFSIAKLCDVSALGLILAQSIGRWGNFFNSEAFGYPTDLPWKLYIPFKLRPAEFKDFEFFHPTFLYESLLDILVFGILLFILKKDFCKKEGDIALSYLILYSIVRIFVEHFRIDSVSYINGVPIAIIVSAGIILLALPMLVYRNIKK